MMTRWEYYARQGHYGPEAMKEAKKLSAARLGTLFLAMLFMALLGVGLLGFLIFTSFTR